MAHAGSGVDFQVDCASSIILSIAESKPSKVLPFSSSLLNMLDFMEGFQRVNAYKLGQAYAYLSMEHKSEISYNFYTDYKKWLEKAVLSSGDIKAHTAVIGFLTLVHIFYKSGTKSFYNK